MKKGFTLVEMLVVIAILGILMAIMVPAAGVIMRRASNARAKGDADIVVATMMKYRMEYNRWPPLTAVDSVNGLNVYQTDQDWINIMSPDPNAARTVANFNKIVFFEAGGGALGVAGKVSSGFVGAFVDPWGNPYKFIVDENGEEEIQNPDPDPEVNAGETITIKAQVIAWSAGADGQYAGSQSEEWDDNQKSWWQ